MYLAPADEDLWWFLDIVGSNWLKTLPAAIHDFKDDSPVLQFLSPKVMRELRLIVVDVAR